MRVNEAVVARLSRISAYQKVVAPFDGVVTQRNVELGSLVTAGSGGGVTPLFRLEQSDVLKVFVDVPQSAAPVGDGGADGAGRGPRAPRPKVRRQGRPHGRLGRLRDAHAADRDPPAQSQGRAVAGTYAQVALPVDDPRNPLRIAASALVIDATGTQVVTVAADRTAHRIPVTLGRDFGKEVEVTAGLQGAERLVVNPRDDLRDGDRVEIR